MNLVSSQIFFFVVLSYFNLMNFLKPYVFGIFLFWSVANDDTAAITSLWEQEYNKPVSERSHTVFEFLNLVEKYSFGLVHVRMIFRWLAIIFFG